MSQVIYMSEQEMSGPGRRKLLATSANPTQRLDYVIKITRQLSLKARPHGVTLNIRTIPDRLILDEAAISGYMQALEQMAWANLESLAQTILDDFSNEIVPRWVEVSLHQAAGGGHGDAFEYAVALEDRQPSWSNPQLLSRLKPWEQI